MLSLIDFKNYYNFIINKFASNLSEICLMKWDQSFTKKFTIMNHTKLLRNLKKELIKYPIKRNKEN